MKELTNNELTIYLDVLSKSIVTLFELNAEILNEHPGVTLQSASILKEIIKLNTLVMDINSKIEHNVTKVPRTYTKKGRTFAVIDGDKQ